MVKVDLKGLHVCRKKSGTYYYAWRGGPRVKGEPGTLEFIENFHAAIEQARAPDTSKFRSLIAAYKASQDYQELAASTKRNWSPWLDKIADYFGDLGIVHFNNPERIRPAIRKWRGRYADKPRTADYGLQVLSRVLAYGVDPLGKIVSNPCEGIKNIYSADRAEIIWTDADLAEFHAKSSPEVSWAVELAAHTGLRRSDLFKLSWSHVGEHGIVMKTGKSGQRRQAVVPLYRALREVLAKIPRRSPVILTSSKERPWTPNGFASSFNDIKHKAWPEGTELHFHDLRGTAATKFYVAGLTEREIAESMGWEEETVSKIIRRYVEREAALMDRIRRLDEAEKRT